MIIKRRQAIQAGLVTSLGLSGASHLFAQPAPDVAALLRAGGCVVMLRHAQTDPGVGDPPGFQIDKCSTQRNLSAAGRAQAVAIGRWFSSRSLVASSVQTSPWCRCKDTAELAFGRMMVLPTLASTFDERSGQDGQTRALRQRLAGLAPTVFEVWVTHQVNVSALTGEGLAMGEGLIIQATPTTGAVKILARAQFESLQLLSLQELLAPVFIGI